MPSAAGAVVVTGRAAALKRGYRLSAATGAVVIAGQATVNHPKQTGYLDDTFTASTDAALTAHTADKGGPWTTPAFTWKVRASDDVLVNVDPNSDALAYTNNLGGTQYQITLVDVRAVSWTNRAFGFLSRIDTPGSAGIGVGYDGISGQYFIVGAYSNTFYAGLTEGPPPQGADWRLTCRGNVFTLEINGVVKLTTTITSGEQNPTTGVYAGLFSYDFNGTTENFSVSRYIVASIPVVGYNMPASAGTSTIAGTSARLLKGYKVQASVGADVIAGPTTTLRNTRYLGANRVTYAISASAAGLVWSRRYSLTANRGTFSIAGPTTRLLATRTMPAARAQFTISGHNARLARLFTLTAAPAAYTIAGHAAGLNRGRRIIASSGALSIVGSSSRLLRAYRLTSGSAAYTILGEAAGLYTAANKVITGNRGQFAIAGSPAQLRVGRRLVAAPRAVAIHGAAVEFLRHLRLVAAPGAYDILGTSTTGVLFGRTGRFVIVGAPVTFRRGFHMSAETGEYVIGVGGVGPPGGLPAYTAELFGAPLYDLALVSAPAYRVRLFLLQE